MKTVLSVTLLFFASTLPAAEATIESIEALGSGCRAGSWTSQWNAETQRLGLELDDMRVEYGRGASVIEGRRNCQLKVTLKSDAGWQFAVRNTHAFGYMQLDRGVQAQHRLNTSTITSVGPFKGDYEFNSPVEESKRQWSACSNPLPLILNIATTVRAVNSSTPAHAYGLIDNDSLNLGLLFDFDLEWRRCPTEAD